VTPVDTLPAVRLALSAAEAAALATVSGMTLPPGFVADDPPAVDLDAATDALVARGVLTRNGNQVVPSIAANLAVLAAPVATVRVELSAHGRGLRAVYAVAGQLGASLFARPAGGVELSLFTGDALGRELLRAVPEPDTLTTADARMRAALGGLARHDEPLVGRLPLAALAEAGAIDLVTGHDDPQTLAADLALTPDDQALVAQVVRRTTGVLFCLVSGRRGDDLLAGEVVWLATDAGWIGLRPDPNDDGRRLVDLVPVAREDVGEWLAPPLAQILEAADGQL
jgi:hypothetical protein